MTRPFARPLVAAFLVACLASFSACSDDSTQKQAATSKPSTGSSKGSSQGTSKSTSSSRAPGRDEDSLVVPVHTPQPDDVTATLKTSAKFGAAAQDISLRIPSGREIVGVTAGPRTAATGCVLIQHGLSSTAADAGPVALLAQTAGLRILAITARWSLGAHRDAEGVPDTPRRLADALRGTITDAQWALDWLGTQPGCNPDHIGFIGVSFGGIMGATMMRSEPRLTAPVFVVAGGDFEAIFSTTSITQFQTWINDDREATVAAFTGLEPTDGIENALSKTPIWMVNGTSSTVISTYAERKMHAAPGAS